MERRLAAIMVCDTVGSTVAIGADEEAVVHRISICLDTVAAAVARFGGRVFNTTGDGLLAEFPSAVNALRAAMEGRAALAGVEGTCPEDMRFGLHLADVLAVGGDLRGDGVNLAARIQATAEPGAIEVSGTLYDHVRRVSPCVFDDLGARDLAGISEPVRILRVRSGMNRHVFQSAPTRVPEQSPARPNSIAVVPFRTASSADEDQQFLADGLTEDLILELSRVRDLFVTSRSASAALRSTDPVEIGRTLGVRFVLAGSIRRLRERIRFNLTLTETTRGEIVWSDRIERSFDEVMEAMDEITARVAATASNRIEHAGMSEARPKRPENMTAYEYYLRGLEHHRLGGVTDAHVEEAIDWFRRAREADPNFGRPLAMHVCAWSYLPDFDIAEAEKMVARAIDLDPCDPEAHRIMGIVQLKKNGDYAASRRHHERAMQLAPNDSYILGRCAAFYIFAGDPDRALKLLDRAEALDPFLPVWVTEERVAALYALGRYDEMLSVARTLPFQTRRSRLYRAAARMMAGDAERARQIVREALTDAPDLTAEFIRTQELYADRDVLQTLVRLCVNAGLPESSLPRLAAV
ncbi:adenylate/guanylate cyclase domain-containing protein [Limibaculum sp. FT325]|uniref:adenylate/guanylate cyclase domain-containing protein n=1 Tax=Thermohalobaculum sediminis TaxID=2939436 RepID=UPI0020BEA0EC|nr:tetratricopeptide repeat protein [Limibaculum sediminis]MCL5778455.1 adenylate/guanylate cyclase domain-containing protein [Limibaculum sediminis]